MLQRAARPPLRRIQTIDHHVRSGDPNAETLAAELEVNPRTIQRDIEFMRDQLRAPLDFCRQHNGYRYTALTFQLPFFQFSEGEVVAFFLAERLLRQYRGTPYETDLRRAFDRFTSLLPDEVSINLAGLGDTLSVTPTVLTTHDIETFRLLAQAVTERRPLDIDYWTASRDDLTTRRIDPYHLTLIDNDWYLVAFCHLRNEVRMFAPLRIRSAALAPGSFTRPDSFDITDYLGDSFRAVRGDSSHEVTLCFTPTTAGRVEEKIWHKTQRLEKQPDGSLLMHLTVSDFIELKRWVLSWGKDCEVLGPEELRKQINEEVSALMAAYGNK
jgi:predicted DNA-binding transcriptional regulator YafY